MSKFYVDGADLTSVADAIRTKGGTSEALVFPDDFIQTIEGMSTDTGIRWEEPLERDFTGGYIGQAWNPTPGTTTSRLTIYEVQAGHHYLVCIGSTVSSVFRVTAFDRDIRDVTTQLSGRQIALINSNPPTYSGVYFCNDDSTKNAFLVVQTSNVSVSGVTTYLLDITNAVAEVPTGGGDPVKEVYTHDGASRMVVEVSEGENFWFAGSTQCNRNLTIDWGDGTTETTDPDTAFSGEFRHAYTKAGVYVIKVTQTTPSTGIQNREFFPVLRWGSEHDSYANGDGYLALRGLEYGEAAAFDVNNFTAQDRKDVTDFCISIPAESEKALSFRGAVCNGCVNLRRVKIMVDNGITFGLPMNMFNHCNALRDVELPDSITSFGNYAFSSCYSVVKINIPNQLTTIGSYCFQGCYALEKMDLPASVTSIGDMALANTKKLTSLIIRNTSAVVTNGGVNTFVGSAIADGTGYIYVPDALVEDYKAATNWSTYAAQIKGLSELPTA